MELFVCGGGTASSPEEEKQKKTRKNWNPCERKTSRCSKLFYKKKNLNSVIVSQTFYLSDTIQESFLPTVALEFRY